MRQILDFLADFFIVMVYFRDIFLKDQEAMFIFTIKSYKKYCIFDVI